MRARLWQRELKRASKALLRLREPQRVRARESQKEPKSKKEEAKESRRTSPRVTKSKPGKATENSIEYHMELDKTVTERAT